MDEISRLGGRPSGASKNLKPISSSSHPAINPGGVQDGGVGSVGWVLFTYQR